MVLFWLAVTVSFWLIVCHDFILVGWPLLAAMILCWLVGCHAVSVAGWLSWFYSGSLAVMALFWLVGCRGFKSGSLFCDGFTLVGWL